MKIRVLILLIFGFNYVLFSQNNTDDLAKETSQPSSVLGNNDRFFYVKNGDYILKKNYKNILLDSFLFNKRYPNKSIKLVFQNDAPVIVSRGGGMVWKVKNDTFKRADNSFDHKMTNQSTVFVRNDTLMKFGGYGYWSRRNFFTYYSETSREWEYYPIKNRTHFPPGVSDINSTCSNDYFYFSGGLKSDPKSPLNKTNNDNVWRFDFKNKLWTNLGTAKFNTRQKGQLLDIGNGRHLAKNEDIDLKNEEFNNFIYDYKNNKISQVKGLNPTLGFNTGFVANDSLYYYRNNQLIGLSLADYLTTDLIEQGTMYVDTKALFADLTQFTGVALIILFIAVLFLYSKNRKRPRLSETGFRFNRVHYPLSKNELMILNLILYNKRVESKTLLKNIYDTELSVAQNNRRKIEIVESLNQKVSSVMGVKNFINSKKSLKDQRMLIYYSNFRTEFIL
jgi:hypothetical protein